MSYFQFKSSGVLGSFIMAGAQCIHFFGYECARAASILMLSAKEVELGSFGMPLAVVIGFQLSGFTLYFYTNSIKLNGPAYTYRVCTGMCLICFLSMLLITQVHLSGLLNKASIILFYAFRETYVSVLSSQQWSYISSSLDQTNSSYIVFFGGIVSVFCAIGGVCVEHIMKRYGVRGLLFTSIFSLVFAATLAEIAFMVRVEGSKDAVLQAKSEAEPTITETSGLVGLTRKLSTNLNLLDDKYQKKAKVKVDPDSASSSVWISNWNFITKHDTLKWMLAESLVHQFICNMLNIMFLDELRKSIPDDESRAAVIGRFFAFTNILTCTLQLFVVPRLLTQQTLPAVICLVPIIVLLTTGVTIMYPSLYSVMFCFGTLKVLEFSVMAGATEMVYVPMDTEERYIGKEYVKFFGKRGGRTVSSLLLSSINGSLGLSLSAQSILSGVLSLSWCAVMFSLGLHLAELSVLSEPPTLHVSQTVAKWKRKGSITAMPTVDSLPSDEYLVGEGLITTSSDFISTPCTDGELAEDDDGYFTDGSDGETVSSITISEVPPDEDDPFGDDLFNYSGNKGGQGNRVRTHSAEEYTPKKSTSSSLRSRFNRRSSADDMAQSGRTARFINLSSSSRRVASMFSLAESRTDKQITPSVDAVVDRCSEWPVVM